MSASYCEIIVWKENKNDWDLIVPGKFIIN